MLDKPYDRRRFLQNAALFSTSLVTSLTHARFTSAGSGKHGMARYDYVVIGAGSAGSVVANRLTEDPNTRVLLLEAGGSDTKPEIQVPSAWPTLLGSEVNWAYFTEKDGRKEAHCLKAWEEFRHGYFSARQAVTVISIDFVFYV